MPSDEVLRVALLKAVAALDAEPVVAGPDGATPAGPEGQCDHWTRALRERADRYGTQPSRPARRAAKLFHGAGAGEVLELGAGQGRDSLFLAREGFRVAALDFSASGVEAIRQKARDEAPSGSLEATAHDCARPLPFADESFDACYSHMLYCMALTTAQLEALSREVLRVLRPGGLQLYTVRTTADPDFGRGPAHGDDRFESNGFIVHFFSRDLVQRLADGYQLLEVHEFEEGDLPRRLFGVLQRKPSMP